MIMILFVLAECLCFYLCGTDTNDAQRIGHLIDHIPAQPESYILEQGSVVQLFCEIHNSSVELKEIMLENADDGVAFDVRAKSFLCLDDCLLMRKRGFNGHFVFNEGICEMMNTTLNIEKRNDNCGFMTSLVKMEGGDSSLLVRNSEWKNIVFCGGGSILRNGEGSFEGIKNCAFSNITMKFMETDEMPIEKVPKMKTSSMEDCQVESSKNVLEGGIVSGTEGSVAFSCNNCTFHHNERVDWRVGNTERNSTTQTQHFMNAEWNECSAECGGALYVHDNSSATLTVENSSFVKCNATSERGGGIFALNISECTVKHSSFIECYCVSSKDYGGAGAEISGITLQVLVENCLFKDGWSGNDAGGLEIMNSKADKTKDCVLSCSFINCSGHNSSNGGGGAYNGFHINITVIKNCLFQGCSSEWRGGGVCMFTNGHFGDLICYCFFDANAAPYGNDVAIQDNKVSSQVAHCFSTRTEGVRYYADGIDKSEWLPNNGGKCRFVASVQNQTKAKDTFSCGLNESCACLTISHCLSQMIVGLVEEMKVLSGTVVEGKGVDIGEKTIFVNGVSPAGSAIETQFEGNGLSLFCVGTGELGVSDLSVIHNTTLENNRRSRLFEVQGTGGINLERLNISMDADHSEERSIQNSLVKMEGGELKMKDVGWSQTFSTTSVMSLPQGSSVTLSLDNCTFNNILRTTAGSSLMNVGEGSHSITFEGCTLDGCGSKASEFGGGMMVEMGNVGSLSVSGGVVRNCYASTMQGRGGGIGLKVRDINANFQISSGFEGNRARWGSDIFVDSINLESTAKSGKITSLTASLDSFDKVRGYDNGNTSLAIPLCIYLLPTPEEIYVSNTEASDHSYCGIAQFPCLTMKHSLTRQTVEKKVFVSGMIMMSDELTFGEQKHEIRGNDEISGWIVSDSSETFNSAMITASVETELSKLIFSLPPSLSSHSTFISSFSQLALFRCFLSLQDHSSELTFLFLSVESETLTIESFSASSINLNGNPLISLSGSGTNTELMNIQWLNITKSNFTEIERRTGSGGCISIDNGHDENENAQVYIEECEFDGCSVLADGSRGGAINAKLKANIQMDITSCTFTGCTAPAGEGKTGFGGGMALKLIDDGSSFVISSPVFEADKPNVAKYGNNLFVDSSNLTKSITNTSLPFVSGHLDDISLNSMRGFDGNDTTNAIPLIYFWRAIGSEIFVGGDGRDMGACGFSDYPCLSIDYSQTRLTEGNERIISVIGKGILQKSVDVSGFSISSNNTDTCSLECLSSLEGAEGAAMKISGITSFELMKFVIPSSFASGVNYLMHVDSSDGLMILKDCSFTKNEESEEEMINFGLIKADEGTVVLEFVSMQSLSFSKDVISVLSSTILNLKNLTMKNVELDGASGLRISMGLRGENNEAEQNIIIEWSLFEEVTQNTTDDISIIRNDNDEPLKMVVRNTTMNKCGGLKCGKGGGMFCELNEGGSFDCSFCTISECFCSTTGRGGWLFLECTSVVEKPLNFVLSNITFKGNSAFRGRDVYVRCHSIDTQIVDDQFLLDFRTPFVKDLAIWGVTTDSFVGEEDLLLRVVKYQSETIFVSSATGNHGDSKQCGEFGMPCQSLNVGVQHIIPSRYSQLLVLEETIINGECDVHDVIIRSLESPSTALLHLNSTINIHEGNLITTSEKVRIESVKFNFDQSFSYSGSSIIHEASGQLSLLFVDFSSVGESNINQLVVFNSTLLSIGKGILHVDNCSISLLSFKKPSFLLNGVEINITNVKLEQIESTTNLFEFGNCGSAVLNGIDADGVKLSEGCIISIGSSNSGSVSVGSSSFKNCSRNSEGASVLSASSTSAQIVLSNCSCSDCNSLSSKGSMMEMNNAKDVLMDSCLFVGMLVKESENERKRNNAFEEICEWSGSLVHSINTTLMMKDATIFDASSGGLSVSSGNVKIEAGNFSNNNPSITKYPSLRRNIICSDSASLTISSLKGGDGLMPNSSLWILNDGCLFEGIVSERASPFFIPVLEGVETREEGAEVEVVFKGKLLLPCNLSFMVVKQMGDEKQIEKFEFDKSGFVSETEVEGRLPNETITEAGEGVEVRVSILFGDADKQSSTDSFIVKNKSESKVNGDERIVEGGKEGKSYWLLIVIIMAIILLIVLIIAVAFIVRWRKVKNEAENLREIVNDNIRKDPKLIEMVTMEMSPEAQWRRAEKEAEKKNEERVKKRIYDTNMQHSESSEHLLSESGSTEYILGRDSDKIPDWALEKVEEEEIRKRTPSPSISSTCSTDSDSTFVRGEDLCPTTSSMSNLVDAMACSSPHEKLIVDLRDSLFMLLHGLNKTKEMPIGTLKEREQTAAQILFWVANLSLHSFDEMENPLQSLFNLSPHIVLFSEHMVICIVMHSDLLSEDDSDSSSISSSTVVTSASNDEEDSLPSSAFEDEDSFRKECLRWKAPELLMNKKMGATKESVAFSIGMMLWECLTLQIPFGEYEAEVAGQKIVNGERPSMKEAEESMLLPMVLSCLSSESEKRLSLQGLKREFIQRFPEGAVMLTMSDAVIYIEDSEQDGSCQISTTDR